MIEQVSHPQSSYPNSLNNFIVEVVLQAMFLVVFNQQVATIKNIENHRALVHTLTEEKEWNTKLDKFSTPKSIPFKSQ